MFDVGPACPAGRHRPADVHIPSWRFITTPPLPGIDNMGIDADALERVGAGSLPATIRFFRFGEPTVSFGRLQALPRLQHLIPHGWAAVQRPTGGGIVYHENDLCVSLVWPTEAPPIPTSPRQMYRWIHALLQEGLSRELTMALCSDVCDSPSPFATRQCFSEPVGYDLLSQSRKVVGGALRLTRKAVLYQGSLQMPFSAEAETRLAVTLQRALH